MSPRKKQKNTLTEFLCNKRRLPVLYITLLETVLILLGIFAIGAIVFLFTSLNTDTQTTRTTSAQASEISETPVNEYPLNQIKEIEEKLGRSVASYENEAQEYQQIGEKTLHFLNTYTVTRDRQLFLDESIRTLQEYKNNPNTITYQIYKDSLERLRTEFRIQEETIGTLAKGVYQTMEDYLENPDEELYNERLNGFRRKKEDDIPELIKQEQILRGWVGFQYLILGAETLGYNFAATNMRNYLGSNQVVRNIKQPYSDTIQQHATEYIDKSKLIHDLFTRTILPPPIKNTSNRVLSYTFIDHDHIYPNINTIMDKSSSRMIISTIVTPNFFPEQMSLAINVHTVVFDAEVIEVSKSDVVMVKGEDIVEGAMTEPKADIDDLQIVKNEFASFKDIFFEKTKITITAKPNAMYIFDFYDWNGDGILENNFTINNYCGQLESKFEYIRDNNLCPELEKLEPLNPVQHMTNEANKWLIRNEYTQRYWQVAKYDQSELPTEVTFTLTYYKQIEEPSPTIEKRLEQDFEQVPTPEACGLEQSGLSSDTPPCESEGFYSRPNCVACPQGYTDCIYTRENQQFAGCKPIENGCILEKSGLTLENTPVCNSEGFYSRGTCANTCPNNYTNCIYTYQDKQYAGCQEHICTLEQSGLTSGNTPQCEAEGYFIRDRCSDTCEQGYSDCIYIHEESEHVACQINTKCDLVESGLSGLSTCGDTFWARKGCSDTCQGATTDCKYFVQGKLYAGCELADGGASGGYNPNSGGTGIEYNSLENSEQPQEQEPGITTYWDKECVCTDGVAYKSLRHNPATNDEGRCNNNEFVYLCNENYPGVFSEAQLQTYWDVECVQTDGTNYTAVDATQCE